MAFLFPLAPDGTGVTKPIRSPDQIDPSILPATGNVPTFVSSGSSYTVASGAQQYAPLDIISDGELILDGELVLG